MADIFALTDTWNDGATAFTAIKMDVADNASAAGSKLLDLLIAGASKFSVSKAGAMSAISALIAGQSLTGAQTTSALDIATTWNTTGAPTALKANVTDTASNALSALIDLQRNGASVFQVDKNALITLTGSLAGIVNNGSTTFRLNSNGLAFGNSQFLAWSNNNTQVLDLTLYRDGAADTLALRRSTNSQILRIANSWTDPSNNEYLSLGFSASNAHVTATKLGTGTQRNLTLGGAVGGTLGGIGQIKLWTDGQITFHGLASARWSINSSGHWYAEADNSYDFGSAGGRARDANIGRNIVLNMTASLGGGVGVINVGNASTAPTTNPTGGGIIYCEAGALKFRGTSGTVTTIAAA